MEQNEKKQTMDSLIGSFAYWAAEATKIRHTAGFNARPTEKNRKRQLALKAKWAYAESGRYLYLFLLARDYGVFPVGSTVEELDADHQEWRDLEQYWKRLYREEFGSEVFA